MKFKILVAMLTLGLVAACGKDDSGLNKNKNTAAPTAQADDATIHQGPVPESDGDDKPVVVKSKKKKTIVKKAPVQEPIKEEPAPAPTEMVPVVAAPSPVPTATPVPQDSVVGLGTTSQKPEELMSRGYGFAITDARFCAVSGKFTNGSRCYAVYQNGSTK